MFDSSIGQTSNIGSRQGNDDGTNTLCRYVAQLRQVMEQCLICLRLDVEQVHSNVNMLQFSCYVCPFPSSI